MFMQPQNPSPAPPSVTPSGNGQPQYDFIFNDNKPGKKFQLPGNMSKKGRILIAGACVLLLIMLVVIIAGMISNAGKGDTQALITAAKQQQELIRVAEIGIAKAKTQDAKNIAITTKLSLSSQQAEMQTAIKTAGLNPKKVLTDSVSAKTDQALTTAEQTNRFDEEFLKIMAESLATYQKSVKAAYDGATSSKLKAALTSQFKSANTLAGVAAGN
jgi:flagellar basal body-associated protein FliL